MENILGLDLGTNSIGWALRNPQLTGNQIEKFGALTYNKGVGIGKTGEYSYAAERTKRRSTRRLYQARKYRLWATLAHLIEEGYCPLSFEDLNKWRFYSKEESQKNKNAGRVYPLQSVKFEAWIKLDFNADGKPDYQSPYQLRKELAEIKLDLEKEENRHKLGRALYHIAQRRGFKSSRKSVESSNQTDNTDEEELPDLQISEKKRNKRILEEFAKYPQAKTLGQLLAFLELDGIRIRENIAQYAIRENYKDEIKHIFQVQQIDPKHSLFCKLIETAPNRNDGSIFYKRPLRSQKGLIGKCTLEPNKYRAPISHPAFEEFRAWSFLNNIKYRPNNDKNAEWQQLPLELRKAIYEEKFFRKSKAYFPFLEITQFVKSNGHDWVFNYSSKTTVTGCPVSARLKDIFGKDYLHVKIPKVKAPKIDKNYYDLEDIWHILFNFEDQECIVDFAEKKLALPADKAKQFITAWNALPVGYAMLSLNAISKITPFLTKGLIYTEAVLLANVPEIVGRDIWQDNERFLMESIKQVIADNRGQKEILNTVNNLISKHKNLEAEDKFGFKNQSYVLTESDLNDIQTAIEEQYGPTRWQTLEQIEKERIRLTIKDCYQSYFNDSGLKRKDILAERHLEVWSNNKAYYKSDSGYYRLPKLVDTLREFLQVNFGISDERLNKLYHPSEISIYPAAKADSNGHIRLGNPKTGSFKNPMAMRTLHELKKLINYMIDMNHINQETRVIVEVARELNDANKRWAIEQWQKQREAENQEFAQAIEMLLREKSGIKADPSNDSDIDKLRLFYEQNNQQVLPEVLKTDEGEAQGKRSKKYGKDDAVRWTGNGKKLIDKYRLWMEQGYQCIYTGQFIKLSDLFNENVIDFEHTLPRSKSFDNSLANLTVCFHDYNRTIKKNQFPTQLNNYDKDFGGYTAILPRLEPWKEKVKRIQQQIEFWKTKSKKASDKQWKDDAIKQRHLWQMELDYWKNKLDRFTITEITNGFKNSQKVDTQLISKYALHYLKTYFDKVEVQKGSVTAEFRKIYQLQSADEKKDRSKHSHHAKDAAVLTLIPVAAKRDAIRQKAFELFESTGKQYHEEPYKGFKREFVTKIDESILINNISSDQTLTPSKRKVRKRGKEVTIPGTNKVMWATGDSIRGQLHEDTFYGAIKPAQRGENGNLLKDENGKFIQTDEVRYVVRIPFKLKKNDQDKGFKTLDEIKDQIVDEGLKTQIEQQVKEAGGLAEAFEKGIYLLTKDGKPHGSKIRHIRVWTSVSEPLKIKKQTYPSKAEYKNYYWAPNGQNVICAYYKKDILDKQGKLKKIRSLEIVNLFELAGMKDNRDASGNPEIYKKDKNGDVIIDENGNKEIPYALLKAGQKVIFYDDIEELKKRDQESLNEYHKRISYRLYKVVKFTGGRLTFQHHLEARGDKELEKYYAKDAIFKIDTKGKEISYGGRGKSGFTEKVTDALLYNVMNNYEPWPKLLYSVEWLDMAIQGKDFDITPEGQIFWK